MLARGIDFWAKKEGYDRIFTGENYNPFHVIFQESVFYLQTWKANFQKKQMKKLQILFYFVQIQEASKHF